MPNIAAVLKQEIARVARKELKQELSELRALAARQRAEISALKKSLISVERHVRRLSKGGGASGSPLRAAQAAPAPVADGRSLRFSAQRLAAQRQKLGLSAADFATILGVSALSVYKWEAGKSRPRRAQLEAIAAARGLGKREAIRLLETKRAAA